MDTNNKIIKLSNNEEIKYTSLFIATGSKPRNYECPGSNLKNIFLLRTIADAANIHQQLSKDKHLVILGSSFIGMEAAAYCVDKCISVTVISRNKVPFLPVFGEDIGGRIKREFEEKGEFHFTKKFVNKIFEK